VKYLNIMKIWGKICKESKVKKYILVYYGGKMESDPKKVQASMMAWIKWFQDLGKAVVDTGNLTMPGNSLSAKGVKKGGIGEPVTGYSILQANNLDAVTDMAKKVHNWEPAAKLAFMKLCP
jgi:hypothetical protein